MPEEYVYKIVIDDSDVNKTIDTIDQRVVALTQRMDRSFKAVGTGTGVQKAAQQVEQAAKRVEKAEQQTTQTIVRGQQQIAQARQQSVAASQREIEIAKRRAKEAQDAFNTQSKALESFTRQHQDALGRQEEAERRLQELQKQGATPQEIQRAAVPVRQARGEVGQLEQVRFEARGKVKERGEDVEETKQNLANLVQARQEAAQQVEQAAQEQAAAEQQAAEQTTQSQQQMAEATRQTAQESINSASQVTQARQQEATAAAQNSTVLSREAGDARRTAQLKKRAFQDAAAASKTASAEQKEASRDLAEAQKAGAESGIEALKQRKEAAKETATVTKAAEEEAKEAFIISARAAQDAGEKARIAGQAKQDAAGRASTAAKKEKEASAALAKEQRTLAKEQRNVAKAERDTERSFIRTTKTFGKQSKELNALARKHGSFNVTLGKSADEMNDLERETNDVIRSDKQLSEELDKLIAKQGKFNVAIDQATFTGGGGLTTGQRFRQAGFAAQRAGVPGTAALGEAAAVGGVAGVAVVGVLLSVRELIKAFQSMASFAAQAFTSIVSGAINAAKEIEIARAQFEAFFQQDTAAAGAALERLQQLSLELGENVVGIGRAFLPEVSSLEQLEEVTKIAVALARFQPEQGILGARISLQEALGGEFRSLQRRFEISPVAIDKIRSAFDTAGVTGLLEELQKELERTGRSVEDLSDTFGVASGRMRVRWQQLLQVIGDPIIEEAKDQLNAIDEALEAASPDIEAIGQLFGELVAKLVELVGVEVEEFLESFDPESLFEVVNALTRVVETIGILLTAEDAGAGGANVFEAALFGLAGSLLNLEGFLLSASLSLAQMRDRMIDLLPLYSLFIEATDIAGKLSKGATGAFFDTSEALLRMNKAFLESGSTLAEVEQQIADYQERVKELPKTLEEWKAAQEGLNETNEEAADRFLKMTSGLDELIALQGQYEAAQLKVNKAVNEFNIQAQLKFEKILTDATRKRIDFEIEAAQKTLDIERKNARKIADIRTKFDADVIKAAQGLSDREADILRKHTRSVLDLEDDLNDKRLEVEKDFQDELERIRDRFNFQAFEAMLANDAKQLRQIRRRQAFEEQQAKKDRDRNIRDVDAEIDKRREKLDLALERELEDARIANARKIRDLEQALQLQLAKQAENRKRDLADQAISEKRKRQELQDSLDRQQDDYDIWWNERNRITQEKTDKDLELMRGYVETAQQILQELTSLGVTFNPITGLPELAFTPQINFDATTEAMEQIQERVKELVELQSILTGDDRSSEQIQAQIESLSVEGLVMELERLQDALGIAADAESFIDTQNLARELLQAQALQIGEELGLTTKEILQQTIGLSLTQLSQWITDFITAQSTVALPEFNIFGEGNAPGDILGLGQQSGLFPGQIPGQFTPIGGQPPLTGPFAPPGAPGAPPLELGESPGAGDVSGVGGFFTPQGEVALPPGSQPQFIFPNVTDAPFVAAPEGADAPNVTPTFGQALGFGQGQGGFPPGTISPINPAAGFDAATFQQQLDEQVEAQVAAELLKRGEIQDTLAFAELMAEKQALGIAALLQEEVEEFQTTSDANIAILETTLARQQEALENLRQDPTLAAEAEAVERSIGIIEDTLQRQRELAAEANQTLIEQEAAFVEQSEGTKQQAIEDTTGVAEQSAIARKEALVFGLVEETTATQEATTEQTGIVRTGEGEKQEIKDESRQLELDQEAEHTEVRSDQLRTGFRGEAERLQDFWKQWLRLEQQGIVQDLRLLAEWVRQRQRLIQQASSQIPGGGDGGQLPGTGGDGDDDGDGGSPNVATVPELQSLAISQAEQLGILTPIMENDIRQMMREELMAFIDWLQGQLGSAALGGSFQPGQPMVVGELGPELVSFPGTGRIDPISALLFRTPPSVSTGNINNIDQSTNLGGVHIPDPRGMPPVYIKIVEGIVANAIRKGYAGR